MRIGLLTSIGHTLDSFFPEIVNHWELRGHQVFAASGTQTRKMASERLSGLTRRPSLASLSAPTTLRRWVLERQLDVVVTNTATASFLARLRDVGCPVVYFCHGLHWGDDTVGGSQVWPRLERAALRNTAGVITLNSVDEAWFLEESPNLPQVRLRHGVGVDLAHYLPSPIPRQGQRAELVWVGEFSQRKRPMEAIKVVQELAARGRSVHLSMLGEGPLWERVKAAVLSGGLEHDIALPGHVDVMECLSSAQLAIHTSAWEGLARCLLEATAVGRPVVGYDVKGVRDVPLARVVPELDVSALATAVVDELDHLDNYSPPPREPFSYEHAADVIADFLREVLQEK